MSRSRAKAQKVTRAKAKPMSVAMRLRLLDEAINLVESPHGLRASYILDFVNDGGKEPACMSIEVRQAYERLCWLYVRV